MKDKNINKSYDRIPTFNHGQRTECIVNFFFIHRGEDTIPVSVQGGAQSCRGALQRPNMSLEK